MRQNDERHIGIIDSATCQQQILYNDLCLYQCSAMVHEDIVYDASTYQLFPHQVAGHGLNDSSAGILQQINDTQYIYKPIHPTIQYINNTNELTFYMHVNDKLHQLYALNKYVVSFYGIQNIQFNNSTINSYLKLSNVASPYRIPNICDIKLGQKTYHKYSNVVKQQYESVKFPYQELYGIRLTGMKVYDHTLHQYRQYNKYFGRSMTPDNIVSYINHYYDNGYMCSDTKYNQYIIDVIKQFLSQLNELHDIFLRQLTYIEFVSSSLLFVYDSDMHSTIQPRIYMIDFCHTDTSDIELDRNYIYGLNCLIQQYTTLLQLYTTNIHDISQCQQLITRPLPMQYIQITDIHKQNATHLQNTSIQ